MNREKYYTGIDYARMIAALLVVTIHTSPLSSYTMTGDFILTRIIARVAVPFFFITSGFFLISRYSYSSEKLWIFVKRTSLIYGIAAFIYIPIHVYNGYFQTEYLLPNIIKDIVFDGTFYHLWYLPASVMGAILAWFLVKKLDYHRALMITGMLYVIGLLGDSYYGIIRTSPVFISMYDLLFQISDYTRNGLFFAPLFFVLGGMLADSSQRFSLRKSVCGFGISFMLMMGEVLTIHSLNLQRHDSMCVFLVPCVYFMFNVLLYFRGKQRNGFRVASLIIYIIHPMMIIVVRGFAKLFQLQSLLIDNSVVHFLAVSAASVCVAVITTLLWKRWRAEKSPRDYGKTRTYLEISLDNLEHNVKVLKEAMQPGCELMAVVKSDAYGHGAFTIATHLEKLGVKAYAAATIDEGIQLRKYGIRGEILILGYTAPERAFELCKYHLTQALLDYDYALQLNREGIKVKVHVKVDTGMHRLGFAFEEVSKVAEAFSMKHLQVTGIFTHLCAADSLAEEDVHFTQGQIEKFYSLIDLLKEEKVAIPKIHIQSSYGLLNYPELKCDYVRVGISLFGVSSSLYDETRLKLELKPVLTLKSKVALLRIIKAGESVGYSRAFVAERDSIIAILPVGYADGYPRNLSCGKSYVLINGCKASIVGKVCMDQMAVDVTDIPNVEIGMSATLIGTDGDEMISAEMLADNCESITNELLSRMGQRVKIR